MRDQERQDSEPASADVAKDDASKIYIGRWNRLVSTTNWEKGRIICEWRDTLVAEGAVVADYSDDAWALRVGGVSGQHVGRLRRVSLRFNDDHTDYDSLYWSHFLAALDWNDAEMWLEGALQNTWSVSQMRTARWEALGAPDELKPSDDDIVTAEIDEDVDDALDAESIDDALAMAATTEAVQDLDDDRGAEATDVQGSVASYADVLADDQESVLRSRPFENLAEMPDDLAEAFETFKLAILNHKLAGWEEISRDDVLASLDALKQLALAPSED